MYWKKYSESIKAEYVERKYWHSPKAVYNYNGYKIYFDHYTIYSNVGRNNYESTVTRIYCQFESKKQINIVIQKATLFVKFLNLFKGNKMKTGHKKFDSNYYLFSNNNTSPSFLSQSIRKKIIDYHLIDLYIHYKNVLSGESLDKNNYELATYINDYKVETNALNNFKFLFEEIIDNLISNYNISPI